GPQSTAIHATILRRVAHHQRLRERRIRLTGLPRFARTRVHGIDGYSFGGLSARLRPLCTPGLDLGVATRCPRFSGVADVHSDGVAEGWTLVDPHGRLCCSAFRTQRPNVVTLGTRHSSLGFGSSVAHRNRGDLALGTAVAAAALSLVLSNDRRRVPQVATCSVYSLGLALPMGTDWARLARVDLTAAQRRAVLAGERCLLREPLVTARMARALRQSAFVHRKPQAIAIGDVVTPG